MATVDKNFKVKNGLIVGDSTNLVNYTSASPSNPFVGQLWINEPFLYSWSSASTWVLIGDGNTGGGGGSASGTPLNIPNTLVSRSASGTFSIGAIEVSSSAIVTNFNSDMLDGYHADHFLAAGTASATYLTQSNASATYVTQQNFDNIVVLQWMGIG